VAGSAGESSGGTAGAGGKATGGSHTGGQGGAEGGAPASAPIVKITSPANITDPNTEGVVVGDTVDVLCEVTASTDPGARPVDPGTVKIQLTDSVTTVTANNTVSTQNPNNPAEYKATFVLTNTAHGSVSFTCSAGDTSRPAVTGSDTITNFVDKGPVIVVTDPKPDTFHALKDTLPVDFTVTPAPLGDGDTGAAVGGVTLEVDGQAWKCDQSSTPGRYVCDVDLTNTTYFSPPPAGEVPVNITAANSRQPTPAVRTYASFIQVDGTPPIITVTTPKSGAMIGGQTALTFTVKDTDSGVDPNTVVVTINQKAHFYDGDVQRWEVNLATGTFTFYFDEVDLQPSHVQATITIDAADKVGNPTNDGTGQRGATLVLYLDTESPIVDLDPPTVRERKKSGVDWLCSNAFDPLGDAVSQRQVVNNTRYFRALVWDLTSEASQDQPVSYYAGPDPNSVYLYLRDNVTADFVIDSNHDGFCDDVKPLPAPELEHLQQLLPIPAAGAASYMPEPSGWGDPVPGDGYCKAGTDTQPPNHLCAREASSLTRVIRYVGLAGESAIYGISPDASGLECTGRYWELGAVIDRKPPEGWLCVAARASDKLGNVGVSEPLIICYDDDNIPGSPDCVDPANPGYSIDPAAADPPITCTDGCQPRRFTARIISDL
jgi:hypothetical protein